MSIFARSEHLFNVFLVTVATCVFKAFSKKTASYPLPEYFLTSFGMKLCKSKSVSKGKKEKYDRSIYSRSVMSHPIQGHFSLQQLNDKSESHFKLRAY